MRIILDANDMPQQSRGASPLRGSALSISGPLWVRDIPCPHCGGVIDTPLPRQRTAIANTHNPNKHRSGARVPLCRVVVVPDPIGEAHQVHRVPDGVDRETVMQRVLETLRAA